MMKDKAQELELLVQMTFDGVNPKRGLNITSIIIPCSTSLQNIARWFTFRKQYPELIENITVNYNVHRKYIKLIIKTQ